MERSAGKGQTINPTGYIFFHVARESLVDFASGSRSPLNDFRRRVTKSAAICSHVQRDAVLFFSDGTRLTNLDKISLRDT